ncbi:MAG: hypothetical protein RL670_388 [Actinomycetota bacterium]
MPTRTLPRPLHLFRGFWRPLLTLLAGGLAGLAYPTFNLWPLIFLSLAGIFVALNGVGFWHGVRLGFLAGMTFYLSCIYWISQYLGPVPLVALCLLEASIFAIGCGLVALVWRWLGNRTSVPALILQILALASLWTAREWVSTRFPYGGFPWSRAAQALSDTHLNRWVWFGGISWLSFVVAAVAAALALAWLHRRSLSRGGWMTLGATVAIAVGIPLGFQPSSAPENGTLRVGAVQGNAKAGLFANTVWGSILENHLNQTKSLLADPKAASVDMVIWPENAADMSPLEYQSAQRRVSALVDGMNKPLIFGTTRESGQEIFNSSVLWMPGDGPVAIYDKKRPVPFAEYVPDRPFWRALAPDLIDLIQHGYTAGSRTGIFDVLDRKAGVLICFEIAIDEINRELVDGGAQVIISQTNNADFGRSAETYQQAALARLQAIATGRTIVNISTVGVSAIFQPDGTVRHQVPAFTAASIIADVNLRSSKTPAQVLGVYLELTLNLLAAGFCLLALAGQLRRSGAKGASRYSLGHNSDI